MYIAKYKSKTMYRDTEKYIIVIDTETSNGIILKNVSLEEFIKIDVPILTEMKLLFNCIYNNTVGEAYYETDDEVVIFTNRTIIVTKSMISNIDYTKANINKLRELYNT